jgi:alpha-L-fucosidase
VGGEYENILTPEQTIPAKPIRVPWESCLTLGDSFSFHYTDNYKSAGTLVHILIDIVSKGGNLALNITPQPDGELPARGLLELRRMGRWLSVNGEGIYGTRIAKGFTANREVKCTRKGNTVYAFNLYDDFARLPRNIPVDIDRTVVDKAVCKVTLLRNGEDVPFTQDNKGIMLKTSELDPYGPEYADCYVLKFGD